MGKEQPNSEVSCIFPKSSFICYFQLTFRTIKHFLSPSRRSPDAVILEGRRLITDAMNAGFYPSLFVFSRIKCLKDIPFDLSRSHEMYQIPFTNIAAWSELKAPPGVMGKITVKTLGSLVYMDPYITMHYNLSFSKRQSEIY